MQLEVYSFEDKDGNEFGSFTTTDPKEARRYAQDNNLKMIANIFEFDRTELVEDFTVTDDDDEDDDDLDQVDD